MRTYRVLLVFGEANLRERLIKKWSIQTPHPLVHLVIDRVRDIVWNIWNIADQVTNRTRPFFSSRDKSEQIVIVYSNKTSRSIKDYISHCNLLCKSQFNKVVITTCMLNQSDRDYLTSLDIKVIDTTDDRLIEFTELLSVMHPDQQTS